MSPTFWEHSRKNKFDGIMSARHKCFDVRCHGLVQESIVDLKSNLREDLPL